MISLEAKEISIAKISSITLGILKFGFFLFMMVIFFIHHFLIRVLIWNESRRLEYCLWSISHMARFVLRVLNIKIMRLGVRGEVKQKLIVANHLSYLDVLILFAEYPSLFVTSQEIKETPILGHLCQLAGCFFVERRKERRTSETKLMELQEMKDKFLDGHNIFLFPEGTSSNGEGVLPFKTTFFQLAVDTDTTVQPLCLKYLGTDAHIIPWYGDMTFIDHLFSVCLLDEIHVKLVQLPEVKGSDKVKLATSTYELIKETYAKS